MLTDGAHAMKAVAKAVDRSRFIAHRGMRWRLSLNSLLTAGAAI